MKVDLYQDPDGRPYATGIPLEEAFPDEDERAAARSAVEAQGQFWTGGGASPAVFVARSPEPVRPFCKACGWRKGGPHSWNGTACKCGHSEPPIRIVEEAGP